MVKVGMGVFEEGRLGKLQPIEQRAAEVKDWGPVLLTDTSAHHPMDS